MAQTTEKIFQRKDEKKNMAQEKAQTAAATADTVRPVSSKLNGRIKVDQLKADVVIGLLEEKNLKVLLKQINKDQRMISCARRTG